MKKILFSVTSILMATVSGAAIAETAKLKEGTEMRIRFEDSLSSASNKTGDTFTISLADSIKVSDGVVIPAGFRGKGEVSSAEKRGMMGKAGELSVRFNYIKVGENKIHIRGSKSNEGDSKVGTTVVLTVLFGPLGLLKKGKDINITSGQEVVAYVDADVDLELPLPNPSN